MQEAKVSAAASVGSTAALHLFPEVALQDKARLPQDKARLPQIGAVFLRRLILTLLGPNCPRSGRCALGPKVQLGAQ